MVVTSDLLRHLIVDTTAARNFNYVVPLESTQLPELHQLKEAYT